MAPQPTINAELERAIEAAKESFSRLPDGDEIFQKCKTGQLSILDVVKAAQGSFRNKKSTERLESLEKHVAWLQGLSSVIDAAVQTKADLMCPVWAPIKFVLKVSNDHSRTTDQILLMLDTIVEGMGHASLYKDLESDADIDTALLALFKDVVDYCIQATEFFGRSSFKRLASMLAKPYKYGFSQMRDRIREHTTHLHRLVIEKEAIRAAQAREEDRKFRCQTWLRPCSMNKVHERHIRTRISGTCEWIQSNQIFLDWKTTPSTTASENMLCISGVHGCGKSVLASAIFEGLKAERHNAILFSFSTTDADRQTKDSVARFLLSRLLSRGLRESVHSIHAMLSDEEHPSTPQLWELLQDLVRQETQPTFYIFDGLDEASDDRQDIVDGMLKILEQCLESKCLFLGRPQAFDNIPELATSCSRRIEMNQTLTQPDIEVFIDTNIKKLDTLQSQGLRAHASEILKRNCGISTISWKNLEIFHETWKQHINRSSHA
ncbi:Tetratricopeptide-like helical protein [Lasiodiplodia theobromae]|uniref:Tetratricopeptide-like helical protein n=1 Tax=Lasiodiplodia theobromae TaxID=45133 RepID=UPI0015C3C9EB|nr:Tetratricopeptide-like helical protein [Lasiodiplodia theobromae]KAF4537500.1 Tetratricopeptide-like helical protein [Lasiodiplodia theobromae]